MKINQVTSAVCLFMVSAMTASLSGCIEKDYDLGDVDTTIGLGAGMTLPSNNSTQDICLDDVLDLGHLVRLVIAKLVEAGLLLLCHVPPRFLLQLARARDV